MTSSGQLGLDRSSLRAENVEQYALLETVRCSKARPATPRRPALVRVRVALRGKLTAYFRIDSRAGASPGERTRTAPAGGR